MPRFRRIGIVESAPGLGGINFWDSTARVGWPSRTLSMLLKVDHYASLSRAVSRLERDSYGARGAVYDLALLTLIRRLQSEVPHPTQEEIDRELLAFRQAVRRVEFGDMDSREWPAVEGARAMVRQGASWGASTFAGADGPSENAQRLM